MASEFRREASVAELVAQLHALGVPAGDVLLVHSSFAPYARSRAARRV